MARSQARTSPRLLGSSTSLAPRTKGTMVMRISPMSWWTGSQLTNTSAAVISMPSIIWCTLVRRSPWVITTPLGAPVLPEVYWRNAVRPARPAGSAGSSSSSSSSGSSGSSSSSSSSRPAITRGVSSSPRRCAASRSRSAASASAGVAGSRMTSEAPHRPAMWAIRSIPDWGKIGTGTAPARWAP